MCEDLLLIGFGAALGFLLSLGGALILQWLDRNQSKKDFQQNLHAELKELIPRLADTHFMLNIELATIDREKMEWYSSCLKDLEPEPSKKVAELLEKKDSEIESINSKQKRIKQLEAYTSAILLRKFVVPLLESQILPIFLVDSGLQQDIVVLRTKIQWLNENIDDHSFFYRKTFEPDFGKVTHGILRRNIDLYYDTIGKVSREAADLATRIMTKIHSK